MVRKYGKETLVGLAAALLLVACGGSEDAPDFSELESTNNRVTDNNSVDENNASENNSTPDAGMDEDLGETEFTRPDSCTTDEECGAGWLCDKENAVCDEGYAGVNGVYEDRLVVAIQADQSGPTAEVGRNLVAGVQAYFDHVNTTRGGVNGRELELKVINDKGDPSLAETQIKDLVADRDVFAFIGNQGDTQAALTTPLFNANHIVSFGPTAGGTSTRMALPDRYIFNVRAGYERENFRIVDFFVNEQNPAIPANNIAVFTEAEADGTLGELGRAGLNGVIGVVGANPHRIPANSIETATYKRGTTDTAEGVENIMRWLGSGQLTTAPNGMIMAVVVVTAQGQPAADFIKRFTDGQKRLQAGGNLEFALTAEEKDRISNSVLLIAATSTVGDELPKILKSAGAASYCSGVQPGMSNIVLSQVVPFYNSNATTILRYQEQLATMDQFLDPGFSSLEGYINARLFVEALTRAGETLTDEHLVNTIEEINDYHDLKLGTLPIDMRDHQGIDEVYGTYLDNDCEVREHEYHMNR